MKLFSKKLLYWDTLIGQLTPEVGNLSIELGLVGITFLHSILNTHINFRRFFWWKTFLAALVFTAAFSASITLLTAVSVKTADVLLRRPLFFGAVRGPAFGKGRSSSSVPIDDVDKQEEVGLEIGVADCKLCWLPPGSPSELREFSWTPCSTAKFFQYR